MFAPDRIETCAPALLQRTAAASRELNAPVRLHCCQSVNEFELVKQLRGTTPLGRLEQLGLLNQRAVLPHGIYISGHPKASDKSGGGDWRRLTTSGATIAHCPAMFARMGEALDHGGMGDGLPGQLCGGALRDGGLCGGWRGCSRATGSGAAAVRDVDGES